MIKGLTAGPGLVVDNGNTSLPWTSSNSSDSFQGMVRLNNGNYEYYSNSMWTTLPSSYATVRLDAGTESVLQWAKAKQQLELNELSDRFKKEKRAAEHPSLTIAWQHVIDAEANRDTEVKKAMADFDLLDKIIGEQTGDDVGAETQSSP